MRVGADKKVLHIKLFIALCLVGGLLAACGGGGAGSSGSQTLGSDFVRAYSQAPNDEPLDPTELTLILTPEIEPFDP